MTDQPTLMSQLITRAVLEIEGQHVEVPLDIARDDDRLRRTLSPLFPGAANAQFERKEDGDTLKVQVIKRLGTKG